MRQNSLPSLKYPKKLAIHTSYNSILIKKKIHSKLPGKYGTSIIPILVFWFKPIPNIPQLALLSLLNYNQSNMCVEVPLINVMVDRKRKVARQALRIFRSLEFLLQKNFQEGEICVHVNPRFKPYDCYFGTSNDPLNDLTHIMFTVYP